MNNVWQQLKVESINLVERMNERAMKRRRYA